MLHEKWRSPGLLDGPRGTVHQVVCARSDDRRHLPHVRRVNEQRYLQGIGFVANRLEGRVVDLAEYEPKMNVTPNAVALKDD